MLNNLSNFFNIFKGKMTKTAPTTGDIIALGTRDPRYGGHYKPTAIKVSDLINYIVSQVPSQSPFYYSSSAPFNNNAINGTDFTQLVTIPANTFTGPFTLEIVGQTARVAGSGSGTITSKIYVNTAPNLAGASLLATCNTVTGTTSFGSFTRTFNFDGTYINGTTAAVQSPSDYTSNNGNTTPFDPTVANFILFATTNSGAGIISTIPAVRILQY